MSARRQTWLKRRQKGIGGTDIASIAGVGYQTALDVYEEKVAPEPIDRAPSPLMLMGLRTERINTAFYKERTGHVLQSPGMKHSFNHEWMYATFDRVALHAETLAPWRSVELKYTPFFNDSWGEDGSDEVPDSHLIQATWQAYILREDNAEVSDTHAISALSGSGDHRIFLVPFDPRLAAMLLELGAAFWKFVVARTPPLDWTHPLQSEISQRLTEIRPETAIELDVDDMALVAGYQNAKEDEKAARENANQFKAELLQALGTNETGILPDGTRIRQKVIQRKAYTVEASSYIDFRVLQPKKAKVLSE